MKLQFLGLMVVGVVAALCAALLVASMKTTVAAPAADTARFAPPPEVEIVVAATKLAPMTQLTAEHVTTVKVPPSQAPAGAYNSQLKLIGDIVVTTVEKGQAFTRNCFATDGAGVHLAKALPTGMRAMSVSLSDYSGLDGLLYPGCTVDVLASFDMRGKGDQEGGVISATILRNVQVLAIEDRTTVSTSEKAEERGPRADRRRRVTLMVRPKQAEELQLAMEHGVISLAMRNPSDAKEDATASDLTRLSELGPTPPPPAPVVIEKPVYIDREVPASAPAVAEKPKEEPKRPVWTTIIMRGGAESTTKTWPVEDRPATHK